MASDTRQHDAEPIRAPARLTGETADGLLDAVRERLRSGARAVTIDLSGVEAIDTGGATCIQHVVALAQAEGAEARLEGARGKAAQLLQLVAPGMGPPPAPRRERAGTFERIGGAVFRGLDEAREAAGLVVDALYWSLLAPLHGQGLRLGALLDELHEMGVRAIGIVALLNLLLGAIIALLSAAQLDRFGQSIWVADLVVIAFARELAAVLTAVIVSARTGAAITAELATMKVQEELDALRSMGVNAARFLIAPKLWALALALPALTVLANVAGNAGGAAVGLTVLGQAPARWWQHMADAAAIGDFCQGLFKSLLFAVIIGLVACHNGLRVEGGARGVGLMTTRSVVMDITFIVVTDMVFATIFFFV